ncbi:MAG TPA: hypothetical protein VL549_16345 [Gemmatimonadales bacterium]|nr:hypothetical protein [Gemmatimonadales bacterium]
MTAMAFALILALVQTQAATPLVQIQNLTPREQRVSTFVLARAQDLAVSAVGAEPWPDRLRSRGERDWQDDEQTTWPAAAWILDARTRAVVWDLRAADTRRESNGLRHFDGTIHLPAGTYEAHYASYPAASVSLNGGIQLNDLRDLIRLGRRVSYGGPYVEHELYKQFALTITGVGRSASDSDVTAAHRAFAASIVTTVVPERNSSARQGFELTRPTTVEVAAIGELSLDRDFDYGWILNADTRTRVWTMTYDASEPAGGAAKNRTAHETLHLKPGRYVAYFLCDDSHDPEDWNGVPPTDPESWGLTLRVADPAARAAVKLFDYEPVPAGQTIVSFVGVGNDENRAQGFRLNRAMDVRIFALGEGRNENMSDYAWISNSDTHKRVWTMRYEDTEHAGGTEKNRLYDSTLHLAVGNYVVHYRSDGSHSFNDWNGAPPADGKYWGVSVFPASGHLNPGDVGPLESPRATGTVLAQLTRMGNDENASMGFQLTAETRVRIYAVGEGRDGSMFDFGWIESANGTRVWDMKYEDTDPAGGDDKNREFDGSVTLPPGTYTLHYQSDGSHSYNDWNSDPPDDPEGWGISVFRTGKR